MDIWDRVDNFNLLAERLERENRRDDLVSLMMLLGRAFEEVHEEAVELPCEYGIKLPVTPDGKAEFRVFNFGLSCLNNLKYDYRDNEFHVIIMLGNLSSFPCCATMCVLSIMENIEGGLNNILPGVILDLYFWDFANFRTFGKDIPRFYSWVKIGECAIQRALIAIDAAQTQNRQLWVIDIPRLTNLSPLYFAVGRPNPKLISLYFAVGRLTSGSVDAGRTRSKIDVDVFCRLVTMTKGGNRHYIAVTDSGEMKHGPRFEYLYLTPQQYLPILYKMRMTFRGIVVNAFSGEKRAFIEKSLIVDCAASMGIDVLENGTGGQSLSQLPQKVPEKRGIRGKRLVFLILAIIFSFPILTLSSMVTSVTDALVLIIAYTWFPALFWWLFLRRTKIHRQNTMGNSGKKKYTS